MQIRDLRNGEWLWVNNAVMSCPHIGNADYRVYSALASFGGMAEIRPSFPTIAERSTVSVRQSKLSIVKLIAVGFVEIKQGGGRGNANVYDLVKATKGCKSCTLSKQCKEKPETVQTSAINGADSAPHKDIEKDKEERHILGRVAFEEFWKIYPRKVEKKKTELKWNRLDTNDQLLAIADVRKRAETHAWKKDNGRYVPHPTTYLNGERWNDALDDYQEKKKTLHII